jgi:anti-sigma factor RsiW
MSVARASVICDRVRAQISLDLDGELSQLERRMLATHLDRCPACNAYQDEVATFTHALRAAPAERPERAFVLPRRRRLSLGSAQVGVAAMLAFAALGLASQLGVPEAEESATASLVAKKNLFVASWNPEQELEQIKPAANTRRGPVDRPGPLSAV